jgi:hypothetical protein
MVFQQWWPDFLPSLECCQSKVTNTRKEQVLVDAAPIFATAYTRTGCGNSLIDQDVSPLITSTTAPDSERAKSMDDDERQAQKSRLNAVLKSFARAGYLGLDCKLFRNPSGAKGTNEYADIKFFLDAGLENIVINENGNDDLMIPVLDVTNVYSYAELTENIRNSHVAGDMQEEQHGSAVFIKHQAPTFQKQEHWLCLVLPDVASRARFLICLRILCLHARASMTETSKVVAAEIPRLDLTKVATYC